MRWIESIIAQRSEPIKNIFPLLPSIICSDVRYLILWVKTVCDTPCYCNYLLVCMFFVVKFVTFLTALTPGCTTAAQTKAPVRNWTKYSHHVLLLVSSSWIFEFPSFFFNRKKEDLKHRSFKLRKHNLFTGCCTKAGLQSRNYFHR